MSGFYLLHKLYTVDEAKKRADEIMKGWEKRGWSKVNDVPPTDKNISEFLQLMKGLGYPIVDYLPVYFWSPKKSANKYKEKLKEVI